MSYKSADLGAEVAEVVRQVRRGQLPPPDERRTIRSNAGISARSLARALKVAPMTLLRWERGEITPSTANAARYRAALDALRKAVSQ